MTELKIGRRTFNVDENDIIMDNGVCCQLITKKYRDGYCSISPRFSKSLWAKLKKAGAVFTNDELKVRARREYRHMEIVYYKFDMDALEKFLSSRA